MDQTPLFEHVLEMKDTSELMVNLAYSSLLYNNKEIAQEVLVLEEAMDELYARVKREALQSAASEGEVEKAMVLLQLADSAEAIGDAAMDIADVVLRDIDPHPIVQMSLMESDTMIYMGTIAPSSSLNGTKIGEANVASETGMWILAIKRGGRWLYGPDEYRTTQGGDLLLVKGPVEAIEHFRQVLSGEERL
ncbi:MAG: PhoU family transcriptional regulator [Thermoplasmata archaeon]|nr:PhoU family transcriptional regulator [Thermoplasmata archaeon]